MSILQGIDIFQEAAKQIERPLLAEKQLEIAVGVYQNSYYLKVFKNSWANSTPNALTADARIFFSVWADEHSLKTSALNYNIHALKLRKLDGYSITSRAFAATFRKDFEKYAGEWENVSVAFGPLTLMQGWVNIPLSNYQNEIVQLAYKFLKIEHLIDNNLTRYIKRKAT